MSKRLATLHRYNISAVIASLWVFFRNDADIYQASAGEIPSETRKFVIVKFNVSDLNTICL